MTKRERWLTSVAIVASLLPLILMAFMIKLVPLNVQQVPLLVDEGAFSRYNYLVSGLFCIVPLGIVVIARYIKHKMAVYDNYTAILCVSIMLSVVFAVVALYGTFTELEGLYVLSNFDFIGFGITLVSIAAALCGNLTRYKTIDSRFAIKNKYTKASPHVFKTVHHTAATVQVFLFITVSVAASLINGIYSLIVFASAVVLYFIWCYVFSILVANFYKKHRKTLENEMNSESVAHSVAHSETASDVETTVKKEH